MPYLILYIYFLTQKLNQGRKYLADTEYTMFRTNLVTVSPITYLQGKYSKTCQYSFLYMCTYKFDILLNTYNTL